MSKLLDNICLAPDTPIRQAIACMNKGEKGIVLVTDDQRRLMGTLVDGDLRRAILAGLDMIGPVSNILDLKSSIDPAPPVTALAGSDRLTIKTIMTKHYVRQLPLVDDDGRVVDLITASDLVAAELPELDAMVMAGGFGKRLHPLTKEQPKPMLPVGDQPLLSRTLCRLKEAGITKVNLSTHYLGNQIQEYFGDGSALGVELNYVTENQPLGTAGALGLLDTPQRPLLIINGDILTQVDFRAMLDFHLDNKAMLTVAVRKYEMEVPFGVVETQGIEVHSLKEKPNYSFFVNAGIYLLEPAACGLVQEGERLDMTDLIQRLLVKNEKVVSFPIIEYWLDVGSPEDYRRAQEDVRNGEW